MTKCWWASLVLLTAAGPGSAAVFTVDRIDDLSLVTGCSDAQPADCPLRTAIELANVSPGQDVIVLPTATYTLTLGGLSVLDDLVISGVPGAHPVVERALTPQTSVVTVGAGAYLQVSSVDWRGDASGLVGSVIRVALGATGLHLASSVVEGGDYNLIYSGGPGLFDDVTFLGRAWCLSGLGLGCEIRNSSVRYLEATSSDVTVQDSFLEGIRAKGTTFLRVDRSVLSSTSSSPGFAVILDGGTFSLRDSLVTSGSQLSLQAAESAAITNTTFVGNSGQENGAALAIGGDPSNLPPPTVIIEHSSFIGNQVSGVTGKGGAIAVLEGHAEIRNSTFAANEARFGGAVWVAPGASATFAHVTAADNLASAGASLFAEGNATVLASLFAGGCAGSGFIASVGGNLESPGTSCGFTQPSDQQGIADPELLPLGEYGGPNPTMPPLPGSPARDALAFCVLPLDQRHAARPFDGGGGLLCDIGAVEAGSPAPLFADGFEDGDSSAWSATTG